MNWRVEYYVVFDSPSLGGSITTFFYYANENLRNLRERYTKCMKMNFSNRLISFDLRKMLIDLPLITSNSSFSEYDRLQAC